MQNYDDRSSFPKTGDYAAVENTSGAGWPGAQMLPRDRTITPPPPARALPHRNPTMIDAETGQALGDLTEKATASAARKASIKATVDQAGPGEKPMLEHLFGLSLPGR